MLRRLFYTWILVQLFAVVGSIAQDGYDIRVEVDGYDGSEIFLGFYLGEGQYVHDTARFDNGAYTFSSDETLEPGFYMVVFPPDNNFFQLLISETPVDIDVKVKNGSLNRPDEIKGSMDTELFYAYADFISDRRPRADKLREEKEQLAEGDARIDEIDELLIQLNNEVEEEQDRILSTYPESLTAMLVKSNIEIETPDFEGTEEEINEQYFEYYKAHYFDNLSMADSKVARTPYLSGKLSYYMDKLTYQVPDSIKVGVDQVLSQFDPEGEAFQVYLVSFLNKYAKSKIVGMDAVYVHIVDKYYAQGLAPWTEEEQLQKIIQNSNKLKPILIGEMAPNLKLQGRDGSPISVHGVDASYTVLFFWDPGCGHCKKSIPGLIDFYNQYKGRGVEVLGICTKLGEEAGECWDVIDERGMDIWLNANDPYLRSRFKQIYDVRVTPQIFVLDQDKKIVMKKIGVEQLSGVLDLFLDQESR